MKNKLLMPLIVVSVVGLIIGSSVGSVLIVKQVKYAKLSTSYDELTNDFQDQLDLYGNQLELYESAIADYENLLNTYNILITENSDLQDAYNVLLADYNLLVINYNSLYASYTDLQNSYDDLLGNYNALQTAYNTLQTQYDLLNDDYIILLSEYALLQNYANGLEQELQAMVDMVKSLPLLDKMTFFYHYCRMNFDPVYDSRLEFARDLILHGSIQYNNFQEIDDLLNGYSFWEFSGYYFDYNSSMNDYGMAMDNCFGEWIQDLYSSSIEDDIFNWITSNIDYRYDSETAYGRNYPIDLYLSALETLKYRAGDCDDYAILGGSFFEVRGWDVKFATIHDNTYYPGELHHAFLFVKVGYSLWYEKTITNWAWRFPGETRHDWIIVDLTTGWQESIWHFPLWCQWYSDNGIDILQFVETIDCDPPLL